MFSWRWAYGIGSIYGAIVLALIVFFGEETYESYNYLLSALWFIISSMYDRTVKPIPPRPSFGLRYRIETLIGVTGLKMAKYRSSWTDIVLGCINIVWRPHLLGILVFEVSFVRFVPIFCLNSSCQGLLFGFSIGINVCTISSSQIIELKWVLPDNQCRLSRGTCSSRIWVQPLRHRRCLWHTHCQSLFDV